jgi:hypothetical protein
MPKCKWCGRSGLLLSISKKGLCKDCDAGVVMEVTRTGQVIQESLEIIEKSKKLDTQLSRLDVIHELASKLKRYEDRGIPTIKPSPSKLLQDITDQRNELILKGLETEIENAWAKASVATTITTKINHLSKALLTIREYRTKIDNQELLDGLERKIKKPDSQNQT